ncbi:hypothetical protein Pelo_16895 [Pelomyxa schiedti]|nr:hypothetical protein Pelo_16895 [Pelomyxa schiedti]
MIEWIQSTEVFRAWAVDWVLTPCDEAVFTLPIRDHFFRVLIKSRVIGSSLAEHIIAEVGVDGVAPTRRVGVLDTKCEHLLCNRKWIVGFAGSGPNVHVWKVVGGDVVKPELHFEGIEVSLMTRFSPFSDDVLMAFPSCWPRGGFVQFCDLQASSKESKLVVTSKVVLKEWCGDSDSTGALTWRPDGSVCVLHYDDSGGSFFLVDNETGKPSVRFPQLGTPAVQIGTSHIFVRLTSQFTVYKTGDVAPSLEVECTWAWPPLHSQSCLIVSTTDELVFDGSDTEITFAVHDGATGFHVGYVTVAFDSQNSGTDVE